jgi:hypothetical protein
MAVEQAFDFNSWFPLAFVTWLVTILALTAAVVVVYWLVLTMQHGPAKGIVAMARGVGAVLGDLVLMSPRRLWALTWLTIRESIRRRIVIVFAVFLLLVAFAGWFLDPGSLDPARLYMSFVLTTTSYLVLLLALFLSALSLPADIKNRTIHTVVTKPVRASEIVLGRVLGFTAIGTALLVVMGAVSYVFVVRGLSHTHALTAATLQDAEKLWSDADGADGPRVGITVRTTKAHNHQHALYLDRSTETVDDSGVRRGTLRTDTEQGHWHEADYEVGADGKPKFSLGGPQGSLVARVPVYGSMRFKDRAGNDAKKGINVGDEWQHRGYIEGATMAAAVWTFDRLRPEDYPNGLHVEMKLGVFRTHKGEITKGVPGSLSVRNPTTGKEVEVRIFASKEFVTDTQVVPLTLRTPDGQRLDLFEDMVSDGQLEIWLRCVAPQQYFGAGWDDLYLRARDASFFVNFFKGYLGIWMQMVLIIGFGVMFSTFLSGPIALLATIGVLVGGLFSDFLNRLASHDVYGGGPAESMYRLVTQQNVISELPGTAQATVAQMFDVVAERLLGLIWYVLPDFGGFSFAGKVADGFDISGDLMLKGLCQVAAFLIPLVVLGYLFLKSREMAK